MPSVSISVVITNYNYGHFLDSCIRSVLEQTYAATEVVVVDDGSTDFSPDILSSYSGIENLKVVSQENKGQTAAINNGFDHATGDVVIFLDSDDRLKPNALETVAHMWSDRFSMISYGLSLIDEFGQSCGSYTISHNPRSGDNLGFLVSRGFVPHYPTSGNAFQREAIARFFPLPEAEWKISTDALLARAAVCAGQVRYVKQELGEYRVHRGNNYYIDGLASTQLDERALNQMANASEFLAFDAEPALRSAKHFLPFSCEFTILSTHLLLQHATLTGDFSQTPKNIRRLIRRNFSTSAVLPDKLTTALLLVPLSVSGNLNRFLSQRIFPKHARPLWLSRAARMVQSRRFLNRRNAFFFRQEIGLLSEYVAAQEANFSNFLCPTDWSYDHRLEGYYNSTKCGKVRIRLSNYFDAAELRFSFSVNPSLGDRKVRVTISETGTELARTEIRAHGTVRFTLPSTEIVDNFDRILDVTVEPEDRSITNALRPAGLVALTALDIISSPLGKNGAVLPLNQIVPFDTVASSIVRTDNLQYESDGNPTIKGKFCSLIIRSATMRGNSVLCLYFSEKQRRTELLVRCGDRVVFAGVAAKNGVAKIELPDSRWFDPVILNFDISDDDNRNGDDGFDEVGIDQLDTLRIKFVGIYAEKSIFPGLLQTYSRPENFVPLDGGYRVFGNNPPDFKRFFDDRWILDPDLGARLKDLEGSVRFRQNPTDLGNRIARISVLPPATVPDDSRLIFVVQVNGTLTDQVELAGRAVIDLPLPKPSDSVKISIDFYAGFVRKEDDTEPYPSGVVIESIELVTLEENDGQVIDDHFKNLDVSEFSEQYLLGSTTSTFSLFHEIIKLYQLFKGDNLDDSKVIELRSMILDYINNCSQQSIINIASSPKSFGIFIEICNDLNLFEHDFVSVVQKPFDEFAALNSCDQVRHFLNIVASGPAYKSFEVDLLAYCSPLILSEEFAIENYVLSQNIDLKKESDREKIFDFYCSLAIFCKNIIKGYLKEDPLYKFAFRVLGKLQGSKLLLFNDRNMRQFTGHYGEALTVALLSNGHEINIPAIAGNVDRGNLPFSKLKIGILKFDLANTPETDLLFGMFKGLDRNIFDLAIFTTNSGDRRDEAGLIFHSVFEIGEMFFDDAVSFIQRAGCDFVFLGSFNLGYNNFNLMFCHKLGRIQIATSAVSPSTTGFKSCDLFLTSRLCEPDLVNEHYTEEVEVWDGPVQCFDFSEECESKFSDPDHNTAIVRRRYGIPLSATVYISGAVTEKIVDELIDAWCEILARSKNTVLVLYPYAKNWLFSYDQIRFEKYVKEALDKKGLGSKRVIILSHLTRVDVISLLRSSDIYLDSFPYSGATTIVEAIKCGLPVVALAGRTQRGLQGAGWLKAYGIDGNVSKDSGGYIDAAVALASDRKSLALEKNEVKSAVSEFKHLNNSESFGLQFGEWILETAKDRLGYDVDQQETTLNSTQTPRYVFHHMPKAGGTSCIEIFKSKFNIVYDYRKPWATDHFPKPLDLNKLTENDLLCGHYEVEEMILENRYPQIFQDSSEFRLFTFVRDPLEQAISNFSYAKENRNGLELEFSDFIEQDYFLKFFNANRNNWKRKLERYWFIGTLDRFDECLHFLSQNMDFDIDCIPRLNASTRPISVENSDVTRFAKINRVSYEIYRHINSELDSRLRKMTSKRKE